MGGTGGSQRAWRLDMHRPAIVVGTVDSLVSKALNRGYGICRATYPIDFALVTNGAHWIIDEIQLCPESTTTLRQLAAFAGGFGCGPTAEPFALTCMSATVPEDLLATVDNPLARRRRDRPDPARRAHRRTGPAARRRAHHPARCPPHPATTRRLAAARQERHRPGTLTLVVLNTVDAARPSTQHCAKGPRPCTLLHSRFRGIDRDSAPRQSARHPRRPRAHRGRHPGRRGGHRPDAAVLVTEAAPWPSSCSAPGAATGPDASTDAELWWLPPARPAPVRSKPISTPPSPNSPHSKAAAVTGEDLLARQVPTLAAEVSVLRRGDLVDLFDTTRDLSGADVDISPYVRDAEDSDAQLAWAHLGTRARQRRAALRMPGPRR